jgi:hypothetical protein
METVTQEACQDYFTRHGLRQPFGQIWEIVADLDHMEKEQCAGDVWYHRRGKN